MQVSDDLYLGNGQAIGYLGTTDGGNPTRQQGVGPLGRVAFHNIVPLALATNNIALLQHTTAATALTLTAGTGVTAGTDGTGTAILKLDTPRCVSLTSTANMSGATFTLVGYDLYGALVHSTLAGPNANTVNFTKAVASVLSVTSDTTDGTNSVSVGTTDIFGLPYAVTDAGQVLPRWGNGLPLDLGTLVEADATSPATASTGDVRGTYMPSTASDGVQRLILWLHLTASQCGANSTLAGAIGVAQF